MIYLQIQPSGLGATSTSTAQRVSRGGYAVTTADTYGVNGASYLYGHTATDSYLPSTVGSTSSSLYNMKGSRMSLYIVDEGDTEAPKITKVDLTAGTNSLDISVTATDSDSGLNKYIYSISSSAFDQSKTSASQIENLESETNVTSYTAYGSFYTISELTQGSTYYIRVIVYDNAGNSSIYYPESITTNKIDMTSSGILDPKVWGKDGSGKAYFEISSDYSDLANEGYDLSHLVIKKDYVESVKYEENLWDKEITGVTKVTGDTVSSLSVGDVIYTRIYDGINNALDENGAIVYKVTNITALETFDYYEKDGDSSENQNMTYTDTNGKIATIPAGFKVSTWSGTNEIENGLVIQDSSGNEYVWIPVLNVIWDGSTTIKSGSYTPMFRSQENSSDGYQSIYYSFSGTTSSANTSYGLGTTNYREPSLVTGTTATLSWVFSSGNNYDATLYGNLKDISDITDATSMGVYLNNQYTKMVESVNKYNGFYVGRYETTLVSSSTSTSYSSSGKIVASRIGFTPLYSKTWYDMYLYENSDYANNPYNSSESVSSMMITGSQWDAVLNYILLGTDAGLVTKITGNHSGNRTSTGQYGNDIMNNIFDLGSNVREWTTEAYSSTGRVHRGGYYATGNTYTASYRVTYNTPSGTYSNLGSRLTLYIK